MPVRRCVVCRTRGEKSSLIRFGWIGGRLVPDCMQKMQCRGTYAHPLCLENKALLPGQFEYGLRLSRGTVNDSMIADAADQALEIFLNE